MSNEFNDWMYYGGCCGDCIYNVFPGSTAICAMDMPSHKKWTCRFYAEGEPAVPETEEGPNNETT